VFSTRSDARRTVTLQWNTSHYVAHINRVTARRSVFCGVRPETIHVKGEQMESLGTFLQNDALSPSHSKVSFTFPRTFHFYLLFHFLPLSVSLSLYGSFELIRSSEIVSGFAGRQSEEGCPRPWLGDHGQSRRVSSRRLVSAVRKLQGSDE
jgi:hypothetical protein